MGQRRRISIALRVAGIAAGIAGGVVAGWWHPVTTPVLTAVATPVVQVSGSPCTSTARACVDLAGHRAWLIRDGRIVFGPVPVNIGGPGEETPIGTFRVWRKDPHHVSAQQHGTPMPYSVFFDRGVAFHSGPLELMSAGCVHLRPHDAVIFYDSLRIGDQVQVRGTARRQATPARPGVSPRHPTPAHSALGAVRTPPPDPAAGRPVPAHTAAVQPAARPRVAPGIAPRTAPAGRALPVAGPGVHILPPAAATGPTTR